MLATKFNRTTILCFVVAAAVTASLAAATAIACPFCSAVQQTLRQEMAAMDVVVIAESIPDSERDEETGEVPLRIVRVLKGESFVKVGAIIRTVYYGSVDPGRRFMLSGVEPSELLWSSPLPVDERSEKYLAEVLKLPEDEVERLRFYQQYLQDESTMLARDAYDEFAITPYPVVSKLKEDMNHEQLVSWVKDPEMPADRRRLYLVMLGICGDEKDVPMLENMLRSTQKSDRTGLDSLIACYLTLAGEAGLKTVDELFLANKQAPYADTYAAIMAIRFHGTETDKIPRADLVKSLHHVLDRPDLADLVIPDLARWSDWTVIDRLVALYKAADADNNWVRVPVVNYMRACPLPEAKQAMEVLKEIDPEAVKRANTFFSAPISPSENAPSTSSLPDATKRAALIASLEGVSLRGPLADASTTSVTLAASSDTTGESANSSMGLVVPNRFLMLSVLGTVSATLMILAYLVISGGPQPQPQVVRNEARR